MNAMFVITHHFNSETAKNNLQEVENEVSVEETEPYKAPERRKGENVLEYARFADEMRKETRLWEYVKGMYQKEGEPQPVGRGSFGDIYDQFKGKAKEAIAFLLRKKGGESIGALHHKENETAAVTMSRRLFFLESIVLIYFCWDSLRLRLTMRTRLTVSKTR